MNLFTYIFQKENLYRIPLKFGLTKSGGCVLANNKSKIASKDLGELLETIVNNYFYIIAEWKKHFPDQGIKFYC